MIQTFRLGAWFCSKEEIGGAVWVELLFDRFTVRFLLSNPVVVQLLSFLSALLLGLQVRGQALWAGFVSHPWQTTALSLLAPPLLLFFQITAPGLLTSSSSTSFFHWSFSSFSCCCFIFSRAFCSFALLSSSSLCSASCLLPQPLLLVFLSVSSDSLLLSLSPLCPSHTLCLRSISVAFQYLSSYWMDCHETLEKHSSSPGDEACWWSSDCTPNAIFGF